VLPLFLALLTCAAPATAEIVDEHDFQILLRTVRFLIPPLAEPIPTTVVFDPAQPNSAAEADAIEAWLVVLPSSVHKSFQVNRVAAGDFVGPAHNGLVILAHGLDMWMDAIFERSRNGGALLLSADTNCVLTHRCAIGVISAPTVRVLLDRQATNAFGITFQEGFRMLVEER
jgi:hypothetical protein